MLQVGKGRHTQVQLLQAGPGEVTKEKKDKKKDKTTSISTVSELLRVISVCKVELAANVAIRYLTLKMVLWYFEEGDVVN